MKTLVPIILFVLPTLSDQNRYRRDFMYFASESNSTDSECIEKCNQKYRSAFEYALRTKVEDFYEFPFHPIVLDDAKYMVYCTLAEQKTVCYSQECNDLAASTDFSPSNFLCSFKKTLFDDSRKCLSMAEPITFLKCDQECHTPSTNSPTEVLHELQLYEGELDRLCTFQQCYLKCAKPIIDEICDQQDAHNAITILESFVRWHSEDLTDWHRATGTQIATSCEQLNNIKNDPVLQLILPVT